MSQYVCYNRKNKTKVILQHKKQLKDFLKQIGDKAVYCSIIKTSQNENQI